MPTGAPTVITGPASEPITVDEAKAQVRVSGSAEDGQFPLWIQTAREMCEEDLGIAVMEQTMEQVLDHFPRSDHRLGLEHIHHLHSHHSGRHPREDYEIRISRPPLQSVTSVTYYDSNGDPTVWDPANYLVDSDEFPGRIVPKYGKWWPALVPLQPVNGVRIRFVAGWPDADSVPSRLKSGMLLIIGSLYKNREAEVSGPALAASVAVKLDVDTQSAVDRLWKRYKRKI
jgi:uncharacterized phiE125 gp8 family phage protein